MVRRQDPRVRRSHPDEANPEGSRGELQASRRSCRPTLVAIPVSELPLVQPALYDTQIPPVAYLSGVLMFIAGLAVQGAGSMTFMALEGLILVVALTITCKAYSSATP